MKWTPVGSRGLEVVLKPLVKERVFHALEKLQDGSYGPTQTSTWQADHHTPELYRQLEPLKALFFPAREHFGGSTKWL